MTLPPGSRLGPYEIGAPIGAGGMGEVYSATDTRLGRDVALKLLPAEFVSDADRLARFEREARVLASLNHTSIAHLYGFESATLEDGTAIHLIAMELVAGEDLSQRLRRGPVPVDEAVELARQIVDALEEAHEKGIVHRDLKPANVKVTPDGKVKVLDFGLAKAMGGSDGAAPASKDLSQSPTLAQTGTAAGIILGTAAYMSPEQARGRPLDKRSDIWAFGVVLFEMLSGERLFDGETVTDVLAAVLSKTPDLSALPAGTPEPVRRLLARCLERDARKRLRDIGEARIALNEPPPPVTQGTTGAPRTLAARALPWLVAAGAAGVAVWALSNRATPAAAQGTRGILHMDIGFPPDVAPVTGRQGGVSISPDGQAITMVGFKNGVRRLYLRRLDAPAAIEISDTTGSGAFSPDGKSLALVRNTMVLTRQSLADRQQQPLAAASDFIGGVSIAWGENAILFTKLGTLCSISPAGGAEHAITALDPARGEVLHSDVLILPGGKTALFSSLSSTPGSERIESVPVEGGKRTVVIERAMTPIWSPTGHLLFGRDGGVWAVPFDAASAKTLGPAVPVIPAGVVGTVRTGSVGLQVASNGTAVYVPTDFDSKRFVSIGPDGSELPLALPPGNYGGPRLSPDGRRMVFERDGSTVESVDLARGTRAVLSPAAFGTAFPIWTRDGARLVFRRFNMPYWSTDDGSAPVAMPAGRLVDSPASPGPDADSYIAVRIRPETAGDIFLMSISGAFEPKPLIATAAYEGSPHLSPDGRWLLYQSNASGQPEIYVRRYPELDRVWPVSEGGGVQARWSPSGKTIHYRGGGNVVAVAFDASGPEPSFGKPAPLFADAYDFGQAISLPNYDVTRDGRFIMLRRATDGGVLRVVVNWTEELKAILAKGGAK